MSKPPEYEQACVAKRNVPYQRVVQNYQGQPMTEGVLAKGQTVWVRKMKSAKGRPVAAYVDGLGIVSVDPRYLVAASVAFDGGKGGALPPGTFRGKVSSVGGLGLDLRKSPTPRPPSESVDYFKSTDSQE